VFAAPRPAGKPVFRALALPNGDAAVVAVMAVRNPPAKDEATQVDRALQQARTDGMADVVAYADELRRTATVRKNPKAFE
jgi:hypothetical protein